MIEMKYFKRLVLVGVVFLIFANVAQIFAGQRRPNMIFILTDDQRYDAMGFMAAYPFLKTPNMDRIRNEGVHFKNTFAVLSMCGPSRASILTGTYPQVNGVTTNVEGREFNQDKTPSFPLVLQQNGYTTGFLGKWHLDHSNKPRKGFDRWVSFSGQGKYNGNTLNIDGEVVDNPGYITDELTDYALEFIENNSEKPFCLYLSHKAVHGPFTPADRHSRQYASALIPKRENYMDDLADKPDWQRVRMSREKLFRLRDNNSLVAKPKLPVKKYNPKVGGSAISKDYLRSISAVDEGIGKIFNLLEKEGILENTCIIFAGDNGYLLGEHQRGDKRVAYNESMRIPLIMRMSGVVKPGSTVEEMVLNIDIAPTILDLAGVKVPPIMQGKSMVPLFNGTGAKDWRDAFLFTYWRDLIPTIPRIVAVRTDRYMYATYPDIDDENELYDLKSDPFEMNNLAGNPACAEVEKKMLQKLEQLKKETGYRKEVPRPRPEPKWNAKEGLICDLQFDKKTGLKPKDCSVTGNNPKVKGGKIGKGLSALALVFDGNTTVAFPFENQWALDQGGVVFETLVRPMQDGVITAQGTANIGFMLYIDNGCPGFVVRSSSQRIQFVDAPTSSLNEWVHIVAQIQNYHNRMKLWVNGELVKDEFMMWPIKGASRRIGGITLGADPRGKIDSLEISPTRFVGEMQYFRMYRQADANAIAAGVKKLELKTK